ncbi:hypothetical protein [Pseudomonas nitroreducens]|uniref:hypothetical protein n=1 Tax=Pseudomonas nitroreducens TaxID=46680 RepID=UPI002FE0BBDA
MKIWLSPEGTDGSTVNWKSFSRTVTFVYELLTIAPQEKTACFPVGWMLQNTLFDRVPVKLPDNFRSGRGAAGNCRPYRDRHSCGNHGK